MAATKEVGGDSTAAERNIGNVDETEGHDLLREYVENTWDMPNDVPEQASITNAEELVAQQVIERELIVEEEHVVEEHSPSHHREFDPEAYFVDAPVEERHDLIPTEFVEDTFRFFIPGSEEQSNCSECSSRGRLVCNRCSGQGNVRCRSCRGSGTKTDSDNNTKRCRKCNGNGNRPCRTCNGAGDISCGRCDGTGQTTKFEYFSRSFTPSEEVTAISETIPEQYVLDAEGKHNSTEDMPLEENVVRREQEVRDIPATVVEYEYKDSSYQIFEIEHEIKSPSHPRDMKQWGKVIAVVALIATAGALSYLYLL